MWINIIFSGLKWCKCSVTLHFCTIYAIKKITEREGEKRGKINGWFFCPLVPYNIWFLGAYLFPRRLSIKAIESKRQFIISKRQLLKHQALPGTASPQDLHRCNQSAYENKKLMHPDWSTPFLIYFSFRLERSFCVCVCETERVYASTYKEKKWAKFPHFFSPNHDEKLAEVAQL